MVVLVSKKLRWHKVIFVPITFQNKASYIARNKVYDMVSSIFTIQTIFDIKPKQMTSVEQQMQIYIPNNLDSTNSDNVFSLRDTFSNYILRVINNDKISNDILNFLSEANNKVKQNGNTKTYSFNNDLNKLINSYNLETIILNNSLISLIESNGATQTTYYTNTRKLLTAISVLNLLSLNGTSYLNLSKAISTKDNISLDIEFYK